MLFYKIKGTLTAPLTRDDKKHCIRSEEMLRISKKTMAFHKKHGLVPFYFIANATEKQITLGVITRTPLTDLAPLERYLRYVRCSLQGGTVTETTIHDMHEMIANSEFLHEEDTLLEILGFSALNSQRGKVLDFGETILTLDSKEELFSQAKSLFMNQTLVPELVRIYKGGPVKKPMGHPVHYVTQTDKEMREPICHILINALYQNHRIVSTRYSFLDITPGEGFEYSALEQLYRMNFGGVMVFRYFANTPLEGTRREPQDILESVCHIAKRYQDQVLTIFCLPAEGDDVKNKIHQHLKGITLVELAQDEMGKEQSILFFKALAKQTGIRTDKSLFGLLQEVKTYSVQQLEDLFNTWYHTKLKTKVYPQYKSLEENQQTKGSPQGEAYEHLQDMIGLKEAKEVIQKALNYYKMQKLYEEKGVKQERPVLHMVFSGNPGTAKTTVARLFANIMKDNGLLSKGQLVEVGRGDLVGKFVGWTAQAVQAKFKEAMGGVLFIDEAYSLVDGNDGSYGDEAINTIVQEMENHRKDVVVIFAGYPDEMEKFLQKNPGLRSRVGFHVPFADYNEKELCQIATHMGNQKGMTLEDAAMEKLEAIFKGARKQKDFGNGRYVRNMLEQATMNQASRLLAYDFEDITTKEITTIKAVDLAEPQNLYTKKLSIGFAG